MHATLPPLSWLWPATTRARQGHASHRAWLTMLLAGVFTVCHPASARPRVLTAERPPAIRAPVAGSPGASTESDHV